MSSTTYSVTKVPSCRRMGVMTRLDSHTHLQFVEGIKGHISLRDPDNPGVAGDYQAYDNGDHILFRIPDDETHMYFLQLLSPTCDKPVSPPPWLTSVTQIQQASTGSLEQALLTCDGAGVKLKRAALDELIVRAQPPTQAGLAAKGGWTDLPTTPGWYFRRLAHLGRYEGLRDEIEKVLEDPYGQRGLVVRNHYHSDVYHPVTDLEPARWYLIQPPPPDEEGEKNSE